MPTSSIFSTSDASDNNQPTIAATNSTAASNASLANSKQPNVTLRVVGDYAKGAVLPLALCGCGLALLNHPKAAAAACGAAFFAKGLAAHGYTPPAPEEKKD